MKETDPKTLGDTLGDVKTFAIVDKFARTLAEAEKKTQLTTQLAVRLLDSGP